MAYTDDATIRRLKKMLDEQEILSYKRVDHWNPFGQVRRDLFGIIDYMALRDGGTLVIQTTDESHRVEREKKIESHPAARDMLKAGWTVEVWAWSRSGERTILLHVRRFDQNGFTTTHRTHKCPKCRKVHEVSGRKNCPGCRSKLTLVT